MTGLSRLTGPVGGDVQQAIDGGASFDVGAFFENVPAKLFGIIPLERAVHRGAVQHRAPAEVRHAGARRGNGAEAERAADPERRGRARRARGEPEAAGRRAARRPGRAARRPGEPAEPPGRPRRPRAAINGFVQAVEASALLEGGEAPARRGRAADRGPAPGARSWQEYLVAFAQGKKVPEVATARLDWSTEVDAVAPERARDLRARRRHGTPFARSRDPGPGRGRESSRARSSRARSRRSQLNLIPPVNFIVAPLRVLEFSMQPGKKPDVDVRAQPAMGSRSTGRSSSSRP